MTGIIPTAENGGVVVRDSGGVCQAPANVSNTYCPPASFTTSCDVLALPNDCTARITPAQINAFQSELLCLAQAFNVEGTWNCGNVCNLSSNFTVWATGAQDGSLLELLQNHLCARPEAADVGALTNPGYLLCDGDGNVVQVQPATQAAATVAAICDTLAHRQTLAACLTSGDSDNDIVAGSDGLLYVNVEVPEVPTTQDILNDICGTNELREQLAACLISQDVNNNLRPGEGDNLLFTPTPVPPPNPAPFAPQMAVQNEVVNGSFNIWQRGDDFPNLEGGAFGPDRFVARPATQGVHVTRMGHAASPNPTPVPGNSPYYMRMSNPNAGASHRQIDYIFPPEDTRRLLGRTWTLNFSGRAPAAGVPYPAPSALKVQLTINPGSGGTIPNGTLVFFFPTLTNDFANTARSFYMPQTGDTGTVIDDDAYATIRIVNSAAEQWTLDVGSVGLYAGDRRTDLENQLDIQRPVVEADELRRAQRYYWTTGGGSHRFGQGTQYGLDGTQLARVDTGRHPVKMREAPSIIKWSNAQLQGGASLPAMSADDETFAATTVLTSDGLYRVYGGEIWADAEFLP